MGDWTGEFTACDSAPSHSHCGARWEHPSGTVTSKGNWSSIRERHTIPSASINKKQLPHWSQSYQQHCCVRQNLQLRMQLAGSWWYRWIGMVSRFIGAYCDALCLWYSWSPPMLSSQCVCRQLFTTAYALSCPTGGYPSNCHNELRNITERGTYVAMSWWSHPCNLSQAGEVLFMRTSIMERKPNQTSVQEVSGEASSNWHFLM